MRKLNTGDLFSFCRVVRKIGIKEELKKISLEANKVSDIASNGFEIIFKVFELATEKKAENEIYEFLSAPFEMKAKEIKEMDLTEFIKNVTEVADVSTLKVFFKQALS